MPKTATILPFDPLPQCIGLPHFTRLILGNLKAAGQYLTPGELRQLCRATIDHCTGILTPLPHTAAELEAAMQKALAGFPELKPALN